MKFYLLNEVPVAAALSVSVLFFTGCGKPPESAPSEKLPTVAVRVQVAENKRRVAVEEVVGTVRAKLRASIEARVSGRIVQMPIVAGQAVKSAELLVQLDVREIQARLDQARAVREQAERDRRRFENLLQQKAVTQQEYDAMEARSRVAEASVQEAETMLGYARVTAPFAGVVSRKYADVGDLASPGRLLLELEDPASLRVEADMPEGMIGRVQPGAKMTVRVSSRTNDLEGVVSEIAPVVDPNSRTFRVKLDLPSASGVRVGEFGRVAVAIGEILALRVPASSVVQSGQMQMVFVVAGSKAQLRLVKTGMRIGEEVELLSGVNAGEEIVAEGAAALRDGQPVQVKR